MTFRQMGVVVLERARSGPGNDEGQEVLTCCAGQRRLPFLDWLPVQRNFGSFHVRFAAPAALGSLFLVLSITTFKMAVYALFFQRF